MSEKPDQEEAFEVVIQSKVKHGILWDLAKQFGSISNLADELGVSYAAVLSWINMRCMPRAPGPYCNSGQLSAKQRAVCLKLVQLTGRKIEDIFPGFIREKLGEIPKVHERRMRVDPVSIEDAREQHLRLEAPESTIPLPEEVAIRNELKEKIADVLGELPDRERNIIEMRYGLGKYRIQMSLEECAQEMGVTKSRVEQLEKKAIRMLHDLGSTVQLVSFL
jgi:RNA polymerase sigma factor (sigma-70 family)